MSEFARTSTLGRVRRRLKRRRKAVGLGLAGLLAATVLFTAWQTWHVRGALQETAAHLSGMARSLAGGEASAAQWQASEAQESAATARRHTRGPVWWTASKLPWVGDDVTAVRTVSEVSADLTEETLPALLEVGSRLVRDGAVREGRIPIALVRRAQPVMESSARDLDRASQAVDGLQTEDLLGVLKPQVVDLRGRLADAAAATSSAAVATELLPGMLGGGEERRYLLMFQNNAEVRATGGMPGALAVVSADDGQIELQRTAAAVDIGYFETPVRKISSDLEQLFSSRIVQFSSGPGINPDFPWAAETLRTMWTRRQGGAIDGVLAIDPVVLSYALEATGPIEVQGQQITSANAVDLLLRDVYLTEPDPEAQNEFFEAVTREVFRRIGQGEFEPARMVAAFAQGVSERRVMLWSGRPGEQGTIEDHTISGEVPDQGGRRPEIGFYLNDSGSDKLTYYLDHAVDVTPRWCGSTGQQVFDVRVTMTSSVPEGELPPSVVGPGTPGVPLGDMLLTTYLYAPVGGNINSFSFDGEETDLFEGTHKGRDVGAFTLTLERGQKRVLEYVVYSASGQTGDPRLQTTPGVRGTGVGFVGQSEC